MTKVYLICFLLVGFLQSQNSFSNPIIALWEARFGDSRLARAVYTQNYEQALELLQVGFDPNGVLDEYEHTNLHIVAQEGDFKMMSYLVKYGGNVNAQNTDGFSVLHRAVESENLDIIDLLIDEGATVDIRDFGGGVTPLHFSILLEKIKATRFLIRKGADVTLKNKYGTSSLDMAQHTGNRELIQLIQNALGE